MFRSVLALAAALAAGLSFGLFDPPSAAGSQSGVVISEFRVRGPAGANDEFVELRNAGPATVDISGWKLQACAAVSGSAATRSTVPANTTLDAGEHYLFANASYTGGVPPDASYAIGVSDEGGVRITSADGGVVDGVGSSDGAVDECREGVGLTLPTTSTDASFERTQDTDDNAADFAPRTSDPQACGACTGATPTVSVTDASVQEGDGGSDTVELTVSLGRPATSALTVQLATRDETATAPDDYASLDGAIVFAPGEQAKTVSLTVSGDDVPEPDETFALELSAPVGVVLGRVTILDDDSAGNTSCSVFAVGRGRAHGRPRGVLLVAAHHRLDAASPRGFVAYVDAGSTERVFVAHVSSLIVAGSGATLSGRGFRLELGPGRRFVFSRPEGSVEGMARVLLRCASP